MPTSRTVDAVVIGAGFSGLYMVHKLAEQGLRIQAFEAGADVGGTWFWNRYPGARCDVESVEYSYTFCEEIASSWTWSARYADQSEIRAYLDHVADRLDLRRHFQFNTRVAAAQWDEHDALWTVVADDGSEVCARFCVMATGNLTSPKLPDIPDLERFKGDWYHSSRWPAEGVDFSGRRVAVIGTGSTGIQAIPQIAAQAAHLYVVQRTPNFCFPAGNAPADPTRTARYQADPAARRARARATPIGVSDLVLPTQSALAVDPEQRLAAYEQLWSRGGNMQFMAAYTDLLTDLDANATVADFVRAKIRATVNDPRTAELLCPADYPVGTKRPCLGTDYYETFNRPNVTLVDVLRAPIRTLTEDELITSERRYPVDTLVFATGFDAMTGALSEIDIRGRGGITLAEKWSAGPTTYLGLMVAGFPNMFVVTGPGSPSVKSNMVCSIEQHVEWIADCIGHLRARGASKIAAEPQAEAEWVVHVNAVADATLYPIANTWYNGANIPGKPRVFMPYVGGLHNYIAACEEVVRGGYRGFAVEDGAGPSVTAGGAD